MSTETIRTSDETARHAHGIETILETYESALNANDIDAILGLYGDTPVFMPQHAPALVGRDAVRAGHARVFSTITLNVRFDVHEVQETGEWAWLGPVRPVARGFCRTARRSRKATTSCSCSGASRAPGRFIATCSRPTSGRAPEEPLVEGTVSRAGQLSDVD